MQKYGFFKPNYSEGILWLHFILMCWFKQAYAKLDKELKFFNEIGVFLGICEWNVNKKKDC